MEEEDPEDYCKGGYHPVSVGEKFKDGRYTVLRKLGWGHFSTVWLARDNECNRYVALKVVKSAQHYTETAVDEVKLLCKVVEANPNAEGRAHVVQLLDHFRHQGPNGEHVCMVFEVLGENLLSLIKKYKHRGIPEPVVKQIMRQVLMGLDYLHRECGIIHTDLKPENVLVCVADVDALVDTWLASDAAQTAERSTDTGMSDSGQRLVQSLPLISAAASSRSSTATGGRCGADEAHEHGANGIAKTNSEEMANGEAAMVMTHAMLAGSCDSGVDGLSSALDAPNADDTLRAAQADALNITVKIADLGNACWTDYHFTNDIQTRQYRSPEVILGGKWNQTADMWSAACMTFELLTGDYLFDPQSGPRYTKDEDHIALVIELLGFFPKHLALSGKHSAEIFNRRGELRHIHRLRYWRLPDVLHEKYHIPRREADVLSSFLLPMLDLNHEKRAPARTMLRNPWIVGAMPR
ncbi:kinase-like domain-containing protein [Thamnocephalis sphaerospora]|uniref:non-specific serine/threonine protein kinase n=1 Tax=Thamnocephalis sphaerospora TaxID=78915 RepID=A0A4P9XKY4_9FUNG|nr:kinase-like domain-containing protein [Thamnocephalis sphaerospora]|eukprot:RKP06494.1 kinase-like domain-containing protein [Thamnocephalis sphaerospora]